MAADGLAPLAPSLARRLVVYAGERFPPLEYAPASAIFFLAAYLAALALVRRGPDVLAIVVGLVTVLLVFFHLRLMDEVKDAQHDALHYPERPVPRGLMTLAEVRLLIAVCVAIELALNAALSWTALGAYLIVAAFTLLMYREFFLGARLRANFLVYTLVHMPSLPLLAIYAYVLAASPGHGIEVDPAFAPFLIATYAIGLALEVARKVHSPNDEPAGVYTYTKQLGTVGACALLIALVAIVTVCFLGLGAALGWGPSFGVPVAALSAVAIAGLTSFALFPSRARARVVKKVFVPAAVLGPYLTVLAHAIARTGG
ncbi:MAG: UbiA family prenyltransferase [Chloroflexota bacterium]|nr:UbiA family prenyltransferase [Chloroflexota bacterium]